MRLTISCANYIDFEIRKGPNKGQHVKIKCGKCILCRIDRRREWTNRLMWQWQSDGYKGFFCTLTYRDECLRDNNLDYRDIQLFLKKLRKREKKSLKYYVAGEYGEKTGRMHWHICLFGNINRYNILKSWNFGGCDVEPINRSRLRYTLKYLDKEIYCRPDVFRQFKNKTPPCHHMSKGLGAKWLNAHSKLLQDGYIEVAARGHKKIVQVPRYYREKYGLPSPRPQIDPLKASQIKMFQETGLSYIQAYNHVYGSYNQSIAQKIGVADVYKNIDSFFFRKKYCDVILKREEIRDKAEDYGAIEWHSKS